ncbi:MAG: response regulator [Deltaproteobacteria bacterium]|nr:response regulator [Deltaproteobacteria bacterium]
MSLLQKMWNLKIKDKLFLTFAGGVALYLFLASASYYFIDRIRDYGDTVYNTHLNISQSVYELKSNLYAVRNSLTTMLLEEDKTQMSIHHKKINEFTKSIDLDIAKLFKQPAMDNEARTMLSELKTVWEAFRDTRDKELIPHILAGRHKEAKAITYGIQMQRFDRFTSLAEEIVRHENQVVYTAKIHVGERIKIYYYFLFIIVITGALAGLLATILISREIGGRLASVLGVAKSMAEGDLTGRVTVDRKDEIGILAEEFNVMADHLQASYNSLEQKVLARTKSLRIANEELERRRIELEFMNEEIRKASELKSRFLATVSHELRTPLNSVIGFTELLKGQAFGPMNEKQLEYTRYINTSGKHLLQLINNILDISKIEAGKMDLMLDEFPFNALIDDVVSIVKPLADARGITVGIDIEDIGSIKADKGKLKQIVLNLLSNAIKFNRENGQIDIKSYLKDGELYTSVKDTGVGIKSEDMDRIWHEFEQIDGSMTRQFEGTGLGLAVTKKLVELHKGRIWVTSEYGKGTIFTFVIPAAEKTISVPVSEAGPVEASVLTDELPTILVVEDNHELRKLITAHLNEAGYNVVGAADGDEALRMAKTLKPFAITLDIMLPVKDGWEVIKEIKGSADTRDIPVIIVSALEDMKKGFSFGACDYLTKPVEKGTLIGALRKLNFTTRVKRGSYTILVVDDDPKAVELMTGILTTEGFGVLKAFGGEEGIKFAVEREPDLIILDLMMPDISGFEVLENLRTHSYTKDIPVIIYTAKDLTREDRIKLDNDVSKIITKEFSIEYILNEVRKVEMLYPARAKMVDPLTNTFNRRYFKRRLAHEIARGERYGHTFSIAMMSIDNLAQYEKRFGPVMADDAVKKLANSIRECVRRSDCLIRYNDIIFLLLLPQTSISAANIVGEKVRFMIERCRAADNIKFTTSIGLVAFPKDGREEKELIDSAIAKMEEAVKGGGNRIARGEDY